MPVPEFEEIKAPLLQYFADGQPHRMADTFEALGDHFGLSPEERSELLPSGTQARWHNRASWACYDLYRAGLLDRPRRGTYQITPLGREIAAQKPSMIDRDYLMKFESFRKWLEKRVDPVVAPVVPPDPTQNPPIEIIERAHRHLTERLRSEILQLVSKMNPIRFERLVLDLLLAMGYGGSREEAAQMTKTSNDEGIDGVINEDRLGLDVIYIQAKRWQNTVGRKEIQSFVGALAGQQATKGIFITTSDFANTATEYVRKLQSKVILINGDRLAYLMIRHDIGVSKEHSFEIKRIDSDYFEEE
ncbi:MAG: restriction endonuclease [Verrucomicrobia bacterium]|nr:restriction endonuclease [Verrucomicrobiota bacterium]